MAESMSSLHIPYSQTIVYNGVTLVLLFFNLVFGELVPKRIAMQRAEAFCMLTVLPVHFISIVLSPFIKLLAGSTKVVLRLLGMKTEDQEITVTDKEPTVTKKEMKADMDEKSGNTETAEGV